MCDPGNDELSLKTSTSGGISIQECSQASNFPLNTTCWDFYVMKFVILNKTIIFQELKHYLLWMKKILNKPSSFCWIVITIRRNPIIFAAYSPKVRIHIFSKSSSISFSFAGITISRKLTFFRKSAILIFLLLYRLALEEKVLKITVRGLYRINKKNSPADPFNRINPGNLVSFTA